LEDDSGRRLTTKYCPCLQYWHTSDQQVCQPEMGECRNLCRENPEAADILGRPGFAAAPGIQSVDDLPPCATTNYCTSTGPNQVDWCYLDKSSGECIEFAASWGFCGREGLGMTFDAVPAAAMLGHELWRERRVNSIGEADIAAFGRSLRGPVACKWCRRRE